MMMETWPALSVLQGSVTPAAAAAAAATATTAGGEFTPLEITKLAVDALTPILVLLLGIYVHSLSKRLEQSQWVNQKLIEKRIAVYDVMAPLVNDVLCFCTSVGSWQELEPAAMLTQKRTLDRHFHVAQALFSPKLGEAYHEFINTCYRTYTGHGQPAKFRMGLEDRRKALKDKLNASWVPYFLEKDDVSKEQVRDAYEQLMAQFAIELGLNPEGKTTLTRRGAQRSSSAATAKPVQATG